MQQRDDIIEKMCDAWEGESRANDGGLEPGDREALRARMSVAYDQYLASRPAENNDDQAPREQTTTDRVQVCLDVCAGIDTESLQGKSLEEYVVEQAFLQGMKPCEGGFEFEIRGLAAQMLAASFVGQFKGSGATNYLEFQMSHPETGPFTITMQRSYGKTPGQLRSGAEAAREQALGATHRARDLLERSRSGVDSDWEADRDALLETPVELPRSRVIVEAQIRLLREHAEGEERQRFRFNDRGDYRAADTCAYAAQQARTLADELEGALGEQSPEEGA